MPTLTRVSLVLTMLAFGAPALAQTGRISGKVTDETGQIVQGARIEVTSLSESTGQKWTATSDKNGTYVIGTISRSGMYYVVASKDGVGKDEQRVSVKLGAFVTADFKLSNAARVSEEEAKANAAKNAMVRKSFEEGVAAAQAGNHQAAATAFTAAATALPTCAECYFNIGVSEQQLKNAEAAEAAFKKAIELKPTYPEAYNALAALYTSQKKFDLAAEAAGKAAEQSVSATGGGNPESLYSAGVGLWNANKFPEAEQAFLSALKADPNHAEAHFMLAKVYVNLGKLKEAAMEYEAYLKIAPTGKNAAEAKTTFEALKPYMK
jgi:tetratricopeptide (TPR) repeat protein